jgi:hypothetical protein
MTKQYEEAKRLLPIIIAADQSHQYLNYQLAAEKLGRPRSNARTVAQFCDLLDGAAALANVPLLALTRVLNSSNRVNPKAWNHVDPLLREAMISRSQRHIFTQADFDAIRSALEQLKDFSNKRFWPYLSDRFGPGQLALRLAGVGTPSYDDAIEDLGTDSPPYTAYTGERYERSQEVRNAVLQRAQGRCEYCGALGFEREDGSRYLESHHILALAKDGVDRLNNVIALCPCDHREAHFGRRRAIIEKEMIAKVAAAEAARSNSPEGR